MSDKGIQLFGSFDVEAADNELEELKKGRKNSNLIRTLEEGPHKFRFLPPPVGKTTIFYKTAEHFLKLPAGPYGFNCPKVMLNQPCPVCREASRLSSSPNKNDNDMARDMEAREYHWALVLDREDASLTVKALRLGARVYKELLAMRKTLNVNFADPFRGIDIIITRTGTGQNDTVYSVTTDVEGRTPLLADEESMVELLSSVPKLEDMVGRVPTLSDIEARLRGEDPRNKQQIGVRNAPAAQLPAGKRAGDYT